MTKKKSEEKLEQVEPPTKPQPVFVSMTDSGTPMTSKIKTTVELYMEKEEKNGTNEVV